MVGKFSHGKQSDNKTDSQHLQRFDQIESHQFNWQQNQINSSGFFGWFQESFYCDIIEQQTGWFTEWFIQHPTGTSREKVHFFFRGNKIQEIRKNLLLGSSDKFIHLDFSSNQITRIEEGAFEVLQALTGSIGIFICNNPIVENVLCHL